MEFGWLWIIFILICFILCFVDLIIGSIGLSKANKAIERLDKHYPEDNNEN
jgi:hypothetical protein